MTTIVHAKRNDYDIYIGRSPQGRVTYIKGSTGYFGNPFKIGERTMYKSRLIKITREVSIMLYITWFKKRIKEDKEFKQAIDDLKGLRLACWCCPDPVVIVREEKVCHGEVILEYHENGKLSNLESYF